MIALLALWIGCQGNDGQTPISGEVSFDGRPVAQGSIALFPMSGTPGASTGGKIEAGRYEIAAEDGPQLGGVYRVEIRASRGTGEKVETIEAPAGTLVDVYEQYIPPRYNDDSQLQIEIKPAAGEQQYNFTLTSRRAAGGK